MRNTRNNPLEDLGMHLPLICDRYEVRDDAPPGAGKFRGGAGVVSETSIATHTAQQVRGPDLVLLFETRFGLGYMRPTPFVNLGPSDGAFGHGGLGGSTAFADPDRRVAFAYVPNQLQFPAMGETTRSGALITALYGCLSR